jgi:signal transduction histidine kinase
MFFHLLRNALEAVGQEGRISVTLSGGSSDKGEIWRLEVQDNGTGMTPDDLNKAKELLFTTKKDHIGCGLNLVAAVAAAMDAEVNITSVPDIGTVVSVVKCDRIDRG